MTDLPIGAIARDIEIGVVNATTPKATGIPLCKSEQYRAAVRVFAGYDAKFADRPDYKLWRSAIAPYFSHKTPWLADCATDLSAKWKDWTHYARLGSQSSDPTIFWSSVALASDLLRERTNALGLITNQAAWRYCDTLYTRLRYEADPLSQCPASSGLCAALFFAEYDLFHQIAGKRLSLESRHETLSAIQNWIDVADPGWKPGEQINTVAVEAERNGSTRLRASHDIYEFNCLIRMLRLVQSSLSNNLERYDDPITEKFLKLAFPYGSSAWLHARSRRLWEEQYQRDKGWQTSERSKQQRKRAFEVELSALMAVCASARDAEQYLEAARHLYLLFRMIPDEFRDHPEVKTILEEQRRVFRYIKEVGLEVDPRFGLPDQEDPKRVNSGGMRDLAEVLEQSVRKPRIAIMVAEPGRKRQGLEMVLERDSILNPSWQTVLRELPNKGSWGLHGYLLFLVRGCADAKHSTSPLVLEAVFRLSLRYGYVRSAGKILARAVREGAFTITKAHVMDFVHAVRRCGALDPFGMRHEKFLEWRSIIIDALVSLRRRSADWLDSQDKLWVHETLLGRSHTHQKSLKYENASRLYLKSAAIYDVDDLREFYSREYNFRRKPMNVANVDTLARFCRRYESSQLGRPVMISMLQLGAVISFVGVGAGGVAVGEEIEVADLEEALAAFADEAELWFVDRNVPFGEQIDWPMALREVGEAVLRTAEKCEVDPKVVILAAEPELAGIPWFHLLNSLDRSSASEKDILVSLAPNLGTLAFSRFGEDLQSGGRIILSEEKDDAILDVSAAVTASPVSESISSLIVVAHGKRTVGSSPFVGVRLDEAADVWSIDDWIERLRFKHVVLHCCHAGSTQPVFMRELGGIPGLGLGLGVEVFFAPVAEVHKSAAIALQEELFARKEAVECGVQYRRAVRKNGEVSLYNIYGNPYECLMSAEPPVPNDIAP